MSAHVHDRAARLARIRPPAPTRDPGDLVRLPLTRETWIYKRLSSHEQKKKSIWSLEQQDALREQARTDGYHDDQIVVEDRDLGISGTKGVEHRPGLAAMIRAIEAGRVESVYVVHISRLTRDQTLIDGMQLGELFRRHNVVLCLPTMRLNLRDPMHLRLYRQEVERAADEIELLKLRLGGPKRHKALAGRWDGRGVPLGYLVDRVEGSPTFDCYQVYDPHAAVVRAIFAAFIAEGSPVRATRALRQQGVIIPDFPPDVPAGRSSLVRSINPPRVPGGFTITPSLVRSIVTNPIYLGWWLVNGQVVREDNHPAIIAAATFWEVQDRFAATKTAPRLRSGEVQLLAGLLSCTRHDVPLRMTSTVVRGRGHAYGRYQCDDHYDNGQTDHLCTLLDARILDDPITEVVLARCSFPEYADAVLGELEREHDTAQETARQRRRELARLEQEVTTLKENLALTRTPEQVQTVFDLIEQRRARIAALADADTAPVGRMLTSAQVRTVRQFLHDLRTGWHKQPKALQNELLRLLLERVAVHADGDRVIASVSWRSGAHQHLAIDRPLGLRSGKTPWTEEDKAWLRQHYPTASMADLLAHLPGRHISSIRKMAQALSVRRDPTRVPAWGEGPPWSADECAVLRRYAAAEISLTELLALLPGRTWDGIVHQRGKLGLSGRVERIYFRELDPAREIVPAEHLPKIGSSQSPAPAAPSASRPT